jgi:hypothetical protein
MTKVEIELVDARTILEMCHIRLVDNWNKDMIKATINLEVAIDKAEDDSLDVSGMNEGYKDD